MGYHLEYRASFKKELRKLSPKIRRAIVERILNLADDPRPNGVTKLRGADKTYRIRQGDYRIIYNIYDELIIIELIKIGHRSDVYR